MSGVEDGNGGRAWVKDGTLNKQDAPVLEVHHCILTKTVDWNFVSY
jgi:hypothetical protein